MPRKPKGPQAPSSVLVIKAQDQAAAAARIIAAAERQGLTLTGISRVSMPQAESAAGAAGSAAASSTEPDAEKIATAHLIAIIKELTGALETLSIPDPVKAAFTSFFSDLDSILKRWSDQRDFLLQKVREQSQLSLLLEAKIKELEAKAAGPSAEIQAKMAAAAAKILELEEQNEKLTAIQEKGTIDTNKLKAELRAVSSKLEAKEKELKAALSRIGALEKAIGTAAPERDRFKDEVERLTKRLQMADDQIEGLNSQIIALQAELQLQARALKSKLNVDAAPFRPALAVASSQAYKGPQAAGAPAPVH